MIPTRNFDFLERFCSEFPGKNVLAEKINGKWVFYTSEQYRELATNFALGLIESGFSKEDKILTVSNNRPQWNFVDMGMAMAGVVHVPAYTSMNAAEYKYILEHCDARMAIVSDKALLQLMQEAAKGNKDIKGIYSFDKIKGTSSWMEIVELGARAGDNARAELEKRKKEISEDDLLSIIYTSGTTGRSKGVMLSHKNLVSNALAGSDVFRLTPEDRYLSIIPVCHVGGRMGNYQTQYSGTCIYYAENMGAIAKNLKEVQATGFDAVPRILEKIFDNVMAKGRALSGFKKKLFFWAVDLGFEYLPHGEKSWFYYQKLKIADRMIFSKWREALGGHAKIVGCGGAALQPRLEKLFWASGLKIINMYGLTETSPVITINRTEKGRCMLGSVGSVIPGVELKIAGDGEILCKGECVMMGYYKDEKLTASVFNKDGWFKTGDIGHMEKDIFLMVTDRKKEIFKLSSGKYVAPQPIENLLKGSVFVDQAMVVGEHEKFASAILVPDFAFLKEWMKKEGIEDLEDREALISIPEFHKAMMDEITRINKELQEWERIKRPQYVTDDWSPASGELSASLKLKRKVISENYAELLQTIY